jgi:hypothetical protein
MPKYTFILTVLFCQALIFSNSYGNNSTCHKYCEDEYEICTQPLNILGSPTRYPSDQHYLTDANLNAYLRKHNILNTGEVAKITQNKIYINSASNFSENPKIKQKEIALLGWCLNKIKLCRKKCLK